MGDIQLDPPQAMFENAGSGGQSHHQVVNETRARLAIKCKCSDNNLYRLQPVFGFVEPGQAMPLLISRKPGPAKDDRLVIQYIQAAPQDTDPQAPFKNATAIGQLPPEVRFPLQAM